MYNFLITGCNASKLLRECPSAHYTSIWVGVAMSCTYVNCLVWGFSSSEMISYLDLYSIRSFPIRDEENCNKVSIKSFHVVNTRSSTPVIKQHPSLCRMRKLLFLKVNTTSVQCRILAISSLFLIFIYQIYSSICSTP